MGFCLRRVRGAVALVVLAAFMAPLAAPADAGPAGRGTALAQATPSAALPAANAPLVVSVDVSGNAHVPTATILSVVRTRPGQPFDEATVRQDLQSIFELGYFGDQVPPLIRQRPGGIAITFRVVENPVVTRIVFSGNAHVPSDTLLALMDTSVGQVLNTNTFHQDVLKINSYYDKIGYGGQVPTHVIGLNIANDGVLSLNVREGLTVRSIVITGNPVLSPILIKKNLTLKEGQPYSEDARDKDYEALKKLYDKYDLSLGDFEAGIDPSTIDQQKGTADVKYDIHVATVGAVQITGNTVTKDVVIRRQLALRPGEIITQGLVRRDYERLNNLGFFEKVDIQQKPGPDPKKPWALTLDWNVKEQRTGTAQVGAGYSGGPTGQGLTGTLSYSQNNINGTGNGASIRVERGARVSDGELSFSVPYLGNTKLSQLYSVNATLFTSAQTNYYQIYQASSAQAVGVNPVVSTPSPSGPGSGSSGTVAGTVPVVLTPNQNLLGGAANYGNRSAGLSANLGRRITDTLTSSVQANIQRLSTSVTLPTPYFLAGTQQIFNQPLTNNLFGNQQNSTTLGVNAPSIADTSNGAGYNLRSFTLGLQHDTRDDIINPRRGDYSAISEELSGKAIGSQFHYTISTLDAAKFYPILRNATLGFHALLGDSTGAIPPSKLFVLTDQQLRGYSQVFYGTEEVLLQTELRVPVSPDRKFGVAFFFDYGGQRIRGAAPIVDQFGNVVVDYNKFLYRTDGGIGLRFDIPQLGFKSIRLDFARGKGGSHTSFGIGQSF
ncbi:MAG: BamA/TamA family outer membrane protein [Candidatus Eremiobacteraeota bacterium]|nr:BamA/TamA family outer membrane protein [Candidatus Eremiobacteraeota bacterium]